jgi:flagellar M-ring protein FliF
LKSRSQKSEFYDWILVDQIKRLFQKLSTSQKLWLAIAVIAVIAGLTTVSKWNNERDFKPLFTGVAAEDAGPMLAKLREVGTEYRLEDNGSTVLVPSGRVAELRIEMASAGLPKSGRIGFELFDKANFGASEFAEQVNYHRAIEGELERSIMSVREVEQARVHITIAKDSLYTEQRQPAKASVLVKLRHAAALSPQNVAAICQLTASAVPGLSPDQVSLVDTSGNLLNRVRPNAGGDESQDSDAALDYRKGVEHDLQNKISSTLEPLLGANHFRVGVSADVDLTSGEQSEEVYDPNKSVMVTSQRTDDGPALQSAAGAPGLASNLPHPAAKPITGASNYARHTENISYQSSRMVKHTRLPQGAVKKLSLSVLVDHDLRWEGTGEKAKRIVEAPSVDKLKVVHDMVAAATGLDTNRGDQLVVEAFPFESTLTAEPNVIAPPPAVAPVPSPLPLWLQKLMQKNPAILGGVAGGVLLAVIALIVILKKRGKAARSNVEMTEEIEGSIHAGGAGPLIEARVASNSGDRARQDAEGLAALKLTEAKSNKSELLTKHLSAEALEHPAAVAKVVRTWLNG